MIILVKGHSLRVTVHVFASSTELPTDFKETFVSSPNRYCRPMSAFFKGKPDLHSPVATPTNPRRAPKDA